SLGGYIRHREVTEREDLSLAEMFNPRDEQGGRNMIWLARTFYPDRKIIVWAASMHLLREHAAIETRDPRLDYTGVASMGHHLSAALGSAVLTVACTAGGGEAGIALRERWKLAPAPSGSFEDLCVRAGLENAVVPVPRADAGPFHGPILARPLGYQPMRADWKRHVDAFVFIKTMEPSKGHYSKQEIESSRDPVAMFNRLAEQFREKAAKGQAYAHKGDFSADWKRWCDMFESAPEARKQAIAKIKTWAAGLSPDQSLTWRIHGLLSTFAK